MTSHKPLGIEMYRLRQELSQSSTLTSALKKFNENVQLLDSKKFWLSLVQIFAELMKAEQILLLIFDEQSNSLVIKAAIGLSKLSIKNKKDILGESTARQVLRNGNPILIPNVEEISVKPPFPSWKFKSRSFISYPIQVGGRVIGVLNLAGKIDGESYDEIDLGLLDILIPQWAVLIEYAELKQKARGLELLSITDPLTGLLNRRYLDERIAEEIKRSKRHNFPLSLMMIDVDDFKSYNDRFSHPEGDKALQIIAHCLKETVRDEDVAVRYGGEEFSILLPHTTAAEAQIIAERLRSCVASSDFPYRQITISIGVASFSPSVCTAERIIRAADDALYKAKDDGRNKVHIFDTLKV
jgi:diguanylate cyclase (GGDEF)-like protein